MQAGVLRQGLLGEMCATCRSLYRFSDRQAAPRCRTFRGQSGQEGQGNITGCEQVCLSVGGAFGPRRLLLDRPSGDLWERLLAHPLCVRWVPSHKEGPCGGLTARGLGAADHAAHEGIVTVHVPAVDRAARAGDPIVLRCVHSIFAAAQVAALVAKRGNRPLVVLRRRYPRTGQSIRLGGTPERGPGASGCGGRVACCARKAQDGLCARTLRAHDGRMPRDVLFAVRSGAYSVAVSAADWLRLLRAVAAVGS